MVYMDFQQAKDILESHGVIDVHLNNAPVWIEQIHETTNSAEVTDLQSNNRMEVPLAWLKTGE